MEFCDVALTMFRKIRMKEADCNVNLGLGFLEGGCIENLRVKKWRMWLEEELKLIHIHM